MAGSEITQPVRDLIRERNSLKAERDALQNDIEQLQQKKADFLEKYEEQVQRLLDRRADILKRWGEYNEAIKLLTPAIEEEEQPAPEDTDSTDSTT
jgi:uncharacterized coiled-coil DUF342 family protein